MTHNTSGLPQSIYKLVQSIPAGTVTTYGHIASTLDIKSPRLVGQALHNNPDLKTIPCHRVVFADGSVSASYAFGGEKSQRARLSKEGVVFLKSGRVDMRRCYTDLSSSV